MPPEPPLYGARTCTSRACGISIRRSVIVSVLGLGSLRTSSVMRPRGRPSILDANGFRARLRLMFTSRVVAWPIGNGASVSFRSSRSYVVRHAASRRPVGGTVEPPETMKV
jgi:hypothetical protein